MHFRYFRPTGILRKSSGFGVFAEIFSKNIMIPSREIPFFGEAPKWFWAIIAKFGCIRVSSGDPNLAIWFFFVSFRLSGKLANVAQNRIQ
jgi:hypothetical protein